MVSARPHTQGWAVARGVHVYAHGSPPAGVTNHATQSLDEGKDPVGGHGAVGYARSTRSYNSSRLVGRTTSMRTGMSSRSTPRPVSNFIANTK